MLRERGGMKVKGMTVFDQLGFGRYEFCQVSKTKTVTRLAPVDFVGDLPSTTGYLDQVDLGSVLWVQESIPWPLEWTMAEGKKWNRHLDQVQKPYQAFQANHLHAQVYILDYGSKVQIRLGKVLDTQDCPAFELASIMCCQIIFKLKKLLKEPYP